MCLFFAETKANTVHGTHSRVNFPNFIRGEESGDNKNSDDPLLSFPPTRILLPSIPSLPLILTRTAISTDFRNWFQWFNSMQQEEEDWRSGQMAEGGARAMGLRDN